MFESDPLNNHVVLLIKAVAEKYLQLRYYYAGRHYTNHVKEAKHSRQISNKLILFTGL